MTDYELNGPWLSEPSLKSGSFLSKGWCIALTLACLAMVTGGLIAVNW